MVGIEHVAHWVFWIGGVAVLLRVFIAGFEKLLDWSSAHVVHRPPVDMDARRRRELQALVRDDFQHRFTKGGPHV